MITPLWPLSIFQISCLVLHHVADRNKMSQLMTSIDSRSSTSRMSLYIDCAFFGNHFNIFCIPVSLLMFNLLNSILMSSNSICIGWSSCQRRHWKTKYNSSKNFADVRNSFSYCVMNSSNFAWNCTYNISKNNYFVIDDLTHVDPFIFNCTAFASGHN